jgi:hypothetical protein
MLTTGKYIKLNKPFIIENLISCRDIFLPERRVVERDNVEDQNLDGSIF